jgi:hypothetical protein
VLEADESKVRVLFRAEQVGTIRLNVAVFADMKPEVLQEKSVKFLGVQDGKVCSFLVRFSKPAEAVSLVDELKLRIARLSGGQAKAAEPSEAAESVSKKARSAPPQKQTESAFVQQPPSKKQAPAQSPVARQEAAPKQQEAPKQQARVAAPLPVPDNTVAVCVLEDRQISAVVTVSRGDSPAVVLLEGTFEGLTRGKNYTIALDGHETQVKAGDDNRVSIVSKIPSASPISSYLGKRLSLSDGNIKIVSEIKGDL